MYLTLEYAAMLLQKRKISERTISNEVINESLHKYWEMRTNIWKLSSQTPIIMSIWVIKFQIPKQMKATVREEKFMISNRIMAYKVNYSSWCHNLQYLMHCFSLSWIDIIMMSPKNTNVKLTDCVARKYDSQFLHHDRVLVFQFLK